MIGSDNRRFERAGQRDSETVGEGDAADGSLNLAGALPEGLVHVAASADADAGQVAQGGSRSPEIAGANEVAEDLAQVDCMGVTGVGGIGEKAGHDISALLATQVGDHG